MTPSPEPIRAQRQSYRQSFVASSERQIVRLPFADFEAHRIEAPLDLTRVRRLVIVAQDDPEPSNP